jgi:intracellular septation protein
MKFLYDLFPLLLFFAAYKFYDIYAATAVAIVASAAQVTLYRLRHRRFETMQLVTLAVIALFGGLTIAFQNDTFIKWKPTLVYWILAALTLGSHWIGRRPAIERLLGGQIELPPALWRRLNLSWGLFFLALGALNIYVAFFYGPELDEAARRDIWVNFKVFGLMALTFMFVLVQAVVMARSMHSARDAGER